MTEEQKATSQSRTETPESEVLDELQQLGHQLTTAIKALWESEESRSLRREIGEGFAELGKQLDTAIKSAQESDAAKQFSEQVKETVDRARESDVAGKLKAELVVGLRELNTHLSKMVDSMESPAAAEAVAETEAEAEPEV
jgi:hypothetical protein